jgi:HAMP domain-containing protein
VPTSQAQGMLVAALAVLAAHYGLMRRIERRLAG